MALRVLDIINFSNRRNPLADSGIRLQSELIHAILGKRPDFFFYVLMPSEIESEIRSRFEHPNIRLLSTNSVARQQGGAFHLDINALSRVMNFRHMDVDLLFVNQPELTPGVLEFFNKVHFFDVHCFNYVHWMDWKRRDNVKNRWDMSGTLSILTSILLSAVTGCNSQYGKERILGEADRWFNSAAIQEMNKNLVPLRPGVNCKEISSARTCKSSEDTIIVFPYRAQKYTGFKSLIEVHLAKLWHKRKDFRLYLTNPSDYDYVRNYSKRYPFVNVTPLDRKAYLKLLWEADIVVGCHNGANQWSLAAVEALAAGCVPLLNKSSFYKEMVLAALPPRDHGDVLDRYFYYRQNFSKQLENLLDNIESERRIWRSFSRKIRATYDWDHRVDEWISCFERADSASATITGKSKIVRVIHDLVSSNGGCSKDCILRHLNWHPKSRHISWTKYRKYLRQRFSEDLRHQGVFFRPEAKPN